MLTNEEKDSQDILMTGDDFPLLKKNMTAEMMQ